MTYKISKKKILVTGATGQIGSFLIEKLVKENSEVFAVGRNKNELKLEQTIKEQACVIDLCLEIINLPVNMVGVVKDKKLQDELKIKLQKLV